MKKYTIVQRLKSSHKFLLFFNYFLLFFLLIFSAKNWQTVYVFTHMLPKRSRIRDLSLHQSKQKEYQYIIGQI